MFLKKKQPLSLLITTLFCVMFVASGCGLLFGDEPATEPTPADREGRALVPTFTATPIVEQTPTPVPVAQSVTESVVVTEPLPVAPPAVTITQSIAVTSTLVPTATPALKARLFIETDIVNTRNGPGTNYGLAGTANSGQSFDLIAKNQQGDWWQVCCVNGQQVWIFGELARVENAESVPVAAQIPAPPVAEAATVAPTIAPAATAAPAAQPTATPQPEVAAPPPAGDPCAAIGGDGCKFKLRNGPKFAGNGGGELKLQLLFIHSGVEGGQPQGSYFVDMYKDGQKLPISNSVRSIPLEKNQGSLGAYNYEYKLPASSLPGGNIAGNYTINVVDGNGERDSTDFGLTVPDGQGEIWMEFDQG